MNILIVEPDKILAGNYIRTLELAGHRVRWQTSAQAAVHALDQEMPDAIILELQMPSHNGVEFLYELRSYPEWQAIPIIVLSLVPEEDIAGAGTLLRQLGVAAYLYKPRTKLRHVVAAVNRLAEPVPA